MVNKFHIKQNIHTFIIEDVSMVFGMTLNWNSRQIETENTEQTISQRIQSVMF